MDRVAAGSKKRKSRAKSKSKSKSKAKRTEPKVDQSPSQMQNQLAYINNLSLMNRVQPRMFLASNMQDRIDYKTQESIENGYIRERIKMLSEAQSLQNQQMMALHQNMMNQIDMRAMMQNNSIAPAAAGADPVQKHLQDYFSTQEYMPTNETQQAIGMGQETDALREFSKAPA